MKICLGSFFCFRFVEAALISRTVCVGLGAICGYFWGEGPIGKYLWFLVIFSSGFKVSEIFGQCTDSY